MTVFERRYPDDAAEATWRLEALRAQRIADCRRSAPPRSLPLWQRALSALGWLLLLLAGWYLLILLGVVGLLP